MPTAVLDVDLNSGEPPAGLDRLEGYGHAFVLIRWKGRPVGQALLPVTGGAEELRDTLVEAAGGPLQERWLHERLGWDGEASGGGLLPSATVAVCTRDRPEDLRACLDALLRLPDDGQEILVIDNCPSSNAAERLVAAKPRVRYVREDRPGLDVARNRALREARGEVVAFTDDDATPDPGWLRALLAGFGDRQVLCVTGLTLPAELETEAQEWFERLGGFGRGFTHTVFEARTHNPLLAGRIGAGVNMALRRAVLDEIGPFDEALDVGTPTRSGGDHDLFTRILAAGYRIVYEPEAVNWHRHRRTWEELRSTLHGYGVGVYAAWTRSLLVEGELPALAAAWGWFRHGQLRRLARSLLRRPGSVPLDLVLAELRGCAAGPLAYLRSRRRVSANLRREVRPA
jgi:glycosyltransferase involved in cell wall biosynthesis